MIKWWRKLEIVVVKREAMDDQELVRRFLVDPTTPFYGGLMELMARVQDQYMGEATDSKLSDRQRLDALASYGAIDELRNQILEHQRWAVLAKDAPRK